MNLRLLGISHHTASLDDREGFALAGDDLDAALGRLRLRPGVTEALILSTCNRFEILVDSSAADEDLYAFVGTLKAGDDAALAGRFYRLAGDDAARHVLRVAASLDSLVVGEPQILGQLKHALERARLAGAIGPALDRLLARAFHAAKRVRTETAIATQPVSVSHLAVDLARQVFGDLHRKTVLLIGAGAMGELAARYLLQQGAARLLVTNRTLARAQALAAKFNATAFALDQLPALGEQADVVISCTGSPQPLVSVAMVQAWLQRRRQHPMLFLDMAVPRDIEPAVHRLENAFVYNIDDLEHVATSNLAERQREAARAELIIAEELERWRRSHRERGVVPTVRQLQAQAETLRALEWERMRRRLGELSPQQEQAVEALTRGLVQKLLHRPMVELKSAESDAEREQLMELTRRLFGLPSASQEEAPLEDDDHATDSDPLRNRASR